MEYIKEGCLIYVKKEVKTKTQTAIITKYLDYEFHTELEYDATNNKVKAMIYNYLDEFQEDYLGEIIFDYEGNQIEVTVVNGIAEIDFECFVSGSYIIKTINTNIRNGEVIINVE